MANGFDAQQLLNEFRGASNEQEGQTDTQSLLNEFRQGSQGQVQAQPDVAQTGSFGQELPKLSQASGLNPIQDIILGFAADDQSRLRFLQKEFEGKDVTIDPQKGLLVDGNRVNPQGPDFGDVLRNLGFVLPVGGQILAGGAALPGGPAAAIGAGVLGGIGGESARLGVGKLLGLDPTLAEASGSLAKEGLLAAGGEVIGRAAGAGIRATGVDKALANFWKGAMQKLGKLGKPIQEKTAEFVGSISPNAVRTSSREFNFQNLTDEFFDENKGAKITSKLLFGNKSVAPAQRIAQDVNGIQLGSKKLAESVNMIKNSDFNAFIKQFSGLADDSIKTMQDITPSQLFNKVKASEDFPKLIANRIQGISSKEVARLGAEIRAKAAAANKFTPFATDDLAQGFKQLLAREGITSGVQVRGFTKLALPAAKGKRDLVEILNSMGSTISKGKGVPPEDVGKFVFFGSKTPSGTISNALSKGQAIKVRNAIEAKADNVFDSQSISNNTKRVLGQFMGEFRERFGKAFDIVDENRAFSSFKSIVDDSKINVGDPEKRLFNIIKGFRSANPIDKARIEAVLSSIEATPAGANIIKSIRRDINIASTIDDIKKMDINKVFTNVEGKLNSKAIIDPSVTGGDEALLANFDNLFTSSNIKELARRGFMKPARASVAAKGFKEASPQILRVQAVANMVGAGALGSIVGGPLGGVTGAALGIGLANPRLIAEILKRTSGRQLVSTQAKQAVGRGASKVKEASRRATPAVISQILRLNGQE